MEESENKKKYVILERGSRDHDRAAIMEAVAQNARAGDPESIKLFRELDAQEKYSTLISNVDDDEYEFA